MNVESALLAMSDRQPEADHEQHAHDDKHVMLSYQWDAQEVVKRIVNELQARGYRTWFGAPSLLSLDVSAQGASRDHIDHHSKTHIGFASRPGQHEGEHGGCDE